jgi:hypothetical protein
MNTKALVLQDVLVQVHGDSSLSAAPIDALAHHDQVARSKRNILLWKSYLPKDCVNAMIHMGWDFTT